MMQSVVEEVDKQDPEVDKLREVRSSFFSTPNALKITYYKDQFRKQS